MVAKPIFGDLSREIMIMDSLVLVNTRVVSAFTVNDLAQMAEYFVEVWPFLSGRENIAQCSIDGHPA